MVATKLILGLKDRCEIATGRTSPRLRGMRTRTSVPLSRSGRLGSDARGRWKSAEGEEGREDDEKRNRLFHLKKHAKLAVAPAWASPLNGGDPRPARTASLSIPLLPYLSCRAINSLDPFVGPEHDSGGAARGVRA